MKILFQIDDPKILNFKTDTSALMCNEFINNKHNVYYYTVSDLYTHNNSVIVKKLNQSGLDFQSKDILFNVDIANFGDILYIRQNPPFDMTYITNLYVLSSIKDKLLILNSPYSILNFSEKFIPFYIKNSSPDTLISCSFDVIKEFSSKHSQVAIKPLYSYGGRGITILNGDSRNLKTIINMTQENFSCQYIICQKYIENADITDKRVMICNGKILGAVNRIPNKDMFVANTAAGGTYSKTYLTEKENTICQNTIDFMKKNDIFLAGVDLLGEYLTEVNITSPTGVAIINEVSDTRIQEDIVKESIFLVN